MYRVIFTPRADAQLKKLDKSAQIRVVSALERIRVRPYEFVKRLVGLPYFRLRAGEYRAILDVRNDSQTIFVIVVGHRKHIYKGL